MGNYLTMYFLYTDESGDAGEYNLSKPDKTGSPYLIYTGIIIHDIQWNQTLNILKNFRKRIAMDGILKYDQEFHCAEMVDPRKTGAYAQISVPERWRLIENFCFTIGTETKCTILAVVLDKRASSLSPAEYTKEIVTRLYQAFNHFLSKKKEHGLVFFDRANEKKISTHVRKLLSNGVDDQHNQVEKLKWILEDPVYKNSADSMFIQSADVVAYTIKEKEFPQAARKKFNADLIFKRRLLANCYKSHISEDDGIIRV